MLPSHPREAVGQRVVVHCIELGGVSCSAAQLLVAGAINVAAIGDTWTGASAGPEPPKAQLGVPFPSTPKAARPVASVIAHNRMVDEVWFNDPIVSQPARPVFQTADSIPQQAIGS